MTVHEELARLKLCADDLDAGLVGDPSEATRESVNRFIDVAAELFTHAKILELTVRREILARTQVVEKSEMREKI